MAAPRRKTETAVPLDPKPETTADTTPTATPDDQGPTVEKTAEELAQDAYIAALRRERAGYVRYSRTDRVAAVDAELERLGVKPGDG